jgi:hypothetical protein
VLRRMVTVALPFSTHPFSACNVRSINNSASTTAYGIRRSRNCAIILRV